jgi:quinol monooxygenase YgiN
MRLIGLAVHPKAHPPRIGRACNCGDSPGMSDPILVIARARGLSTERERFIAAARDCIAATRREQGCLGYDICESLSDPGHFISVESWEKRDDVDRHMQQPHLQAFLAIAGTCFSAAPVIEVVEPRSLDRL